MDWRQRNELRLLPLKGEVDARSASGGDQTMQPCDPHPDPALFKGRERAECAATASTRNHSVPVPMMFGLVRIAQCPDAARIAGGSALGVLLTAITGAPGRTAGTWRRSKPPPLISSAKLFERVTRKSMMWLRTP